MAASQRPTKRMESRCTPATARATLSFEITRYSLHKGMGKEKFIQSTPVSVGGHEWCIRYYPDGEKNVEDHISVFLARLGNGPKVRAFFDLRLVNQENGLSSTVKSCLESPVEFSTINTSWGNRNFMRRSELEQSAYLRGDRLVIECDLNVIKEPIVAETPIAVELLAPSSDLSENFGKLLETAEEADVTFDIEGELFPAHKIVLATRSPVFKAELYGSMRDKGRQNITVQDMQPAVFKALLRFIYTDSLPSMDDLDGDEDIEMVKHLLVAADRYAMERMKTECEGMLCKNLDVKTVATMLALADQHHCSKLKDACVEFIMSSNRMDDILASQGYVHLKKSCPAVLVDIFEWVTKSLKIRCANPGLASQ